MFNKQKPIEMILDHQAEHDERLEGDEPSEVINLENKVFPRNKIVVKIFDITPFIIPVRLLECAKFLDRV